MPPDATLIFAQQVVLVRRRPASRCHPVFLHQIGASHLKEEHVDVRAGNLICHTPQAVAEQRHAAPSPAPKTCSRRLAESSSADDYSITSGIFHELRWTTSRTMVARPSFGSSHSAKRRSGTSPGSLGRCATGG